MSDGAREYGSFHHLQKFDLFFYGCITNIGRFCCAICYLARTKSVGTNNARPRESRHSDDIMMCCCSAWARCTFAAAMSVGVCDFGYPNSRCYCWLAYRILPYGTKRGPGRRMLGSISDLETIAQSNDCLRCILPGRHIKEYRCRANKGME